ncbi:unnamed protein product [Onchocerca flexuosa]|uniref:Ovule protein n=1 Tax=Onchocerca flexuosa TaxID=387005 RepID=A0A183HHU4_9BILA|nr:unnamed protein product [Onchocerca flexuosa]
MRYLGGRRSGALKQESSKISSLALGDIVAAVFVPFFSSSTHTTDDCSFSFIPLIASNNSQFFDDSILQLPKHSK